MQERVALLGRARRSSLRLALWVMLVALLASVAEAQTITIDSVPAYKSLGFITGSAGGVDPNTHHVAVYIQIEGGGWWTKPTSVTPTVPLDAGSNFIANVGTGGSGSLDSRATIFCAALLPDSVAPPLAEGAGRIPASLIRASVLAMSELPSAWSDAGFEAFKAYFDAEPFHQMLGVTVVERRPGYGRIQLDKDPNTPAGIGGSVHGGVLASMVDISMLVAVFAELRPGERPAGTADLQISYLRQAQGERIFAEANVIKRGRQLANVSVEISDGEGRLCATGRVLYAFRAG